MAVFDNLRTNVSNTIRLRFTVQLEGSAANAFTLELSYNVTRATMGSLPVTQHPFSRYAGVATHTEIAPLDLYGTSIQGWVCSGRALSCASLDGLFAVSARVLRADGSPLPLLAASASERPLPAQDGSVLRFAFTPQSAASDAQVRFSASFAPACAATGGRSELHAASRPFNVFQAAVASILVLQQPPASALVGRPFAVAAALKDALNNTVRAPQHMRLALDPSTPAALLGSACGPPALPLGQCSALPLVAGVTDSVEFGHVVFATPGAFRLRFLLDNLTLASPPTRLITVALAPPDEHTSLSVELQPSSSARAGAPLAVAPALGLRDQFGNLLDREFVLRSVEVTTEAEVLYSAPERTKLSGQSLAFPGLQLTKTGHDILSIAQGLCHSPRPLFPRSLAFSSCLQALVCRRLFLLAFSCLVFFPAQCFRRPSRSALLPSF